MRLYRNVLYGTCRFMAIGAYTSALLTKAFDVPIYFGILAGMLTASVVGAIVSYPTLKLRDDYFIIVTLGIGEAIKLIIQNATSITGGARVWQTYRREAILLMCGLSLF